MSVDIVRVGHESDRDAFTAGAIARVSYEPLILALATNRQHASYPVLWAAGVFLATGSQRSRMRSVAGANRTAAMQDTEA
jgi:flavin reductase (DIM6/NTAB) family NADH-FMN oxidoreductase RutF